MNLEREVKKYREDKLKTAKNLKLSLRRALLGEEPLESERHPWWRDYNLEFVKNWRNRLLREGIPEKDLVELNLATIYVNEYIRLRQRERPGKPMDPVVKAELSRKIVEKFEAFHKDLPALIERWLAMKVKASGIKI